MARQHAAIATACFRSRSGAADPARQTRGNLLQFGEPVLPAVDAVGNNVQTPVFMGTAQDVKHLDAQFRPRAVTAAVLRHGLTIDVRAKEQRQEE